MLGLLSPRFLIGLVLVSALAFTHFFVYRAGAANVRQKWDASIAAANNEARKSEQLRQSRVDEAVRTAASRQRSIAAGNASVAGELAGLRIAADTAERVAQESSAAAAQYRATCTALLKEGGGLLAEVQRAADGHSSDVRLLLEAWPKE